MKVTAIIRKDQPDENGLCKILIRTNNGDSRRYSTTEYKVKASQFKKGKVVNHERSAAINLSLQKQVEEITKGTAADHRLMFHAYARSFISHAEKTATRSKGTLRYYRGEVSKFLKFTADLPLHKITPDVLKSYHIYMKGLGNQHNTVWKSFKFFKTLFNSAKKEGIIHSSPFEKFQPGGFKQTTRIFLTADEVRKILALPIQDYSLQRVRAWFVVQCLTGLRVGDLKHLNVETILKENRIVISTEKTNELVSQPLKPDVKKLLAEVRSFDISPEEYNRQLKSIAALAGIKKNLTSHVGRHTFAVRFMELGGSIEVASKLLGHTNIKTTGIYAKIQNKRVDEEMSGFGF
jgi:site-specific recombinase XerD